jgi:hypothetical protein
MSLNFEMASAEFTKSMTMPRGLACTAPPSCAHANDPAIPVVSMRKRMKITPKRTGIA